MSDDPARPYVWRRSQYKDIGLLPMVIAMSGGAIAAFAMTTNLVSNVRRDVTRWEAESRSIKAANLVLESKVQQFEQRIKVLEARRLTD